MYWNGREFVMSSVFYHCNSPTWIKWLGEGHPSRCLQSVGLWSEWAGVTEGPASARAWQQVLTISPARSGSCRLPSGFCSLSSLPACKQHSCPRSLPHTQGTRFLQALPFLSIQGKTLAFWSPVTFLLESRKHHTAEGKIWFIHVPITVILIFLKAGVKKWDGGFTPRRCLKISYYDSREFCSIPDGFPFKSKQTYPDFPFSFHVSVSVPFSIEDIFQDCQWLVMCWNPLCACFFLYILQFIN